MLKRNNVTSFIYILSFTQIYENATNVSCDICHNYSAIQMDTNAKKA